MSFDLSDYEVGDEFETSPHELGRVISAILAEEGTFLYEGNSITITSLPKRKSVVEKEVSVKVPEPVIEEPKQVETVQEPVKEEPVKEEPKQVEKTPEPVKEEPVKEEPKKIENVQESKPVEKAPVKEESKPVEKAPVKEEPKPTVKTSYAPKPTGRPRKTA